MLVSPLQNPRAVAALADGDEAALRWITRRMFEPRYANLVHKYT